MCRAQEIDYCFHAAWKRHVPPAKFTAIFEVFRIFQILFVFIADSIEL